MPEWRHRGVGVRGGLASDPSPWPEQNRATAGTEPGRRSQDGAGAGPLPLGSDPLVMGALVIAHLVDPGAVAGVAGEGLGDEGVEDRQGLLDGVLAHTEAGDVGVIVLAGQARGLDGPHEGGAHAIDLVGGDLLAVAGAAQDDAEAAGVRDDALGAGEAEPALVNSHGLLVTSVIDDLATVPSPVVLQMVLELESGVVGTDVNTHERIVPHASDFRLRSGDADARTHAGVRERHGGPTREEAHPHGGAHGTSET